MVLRRNWCGECGKRFRNDRGNRFFVSRGEKMRTCHLCGRVRDDSEFVAAHCAWCDELMSDALDGSENGVEE
jgi:hypothetical protein